MNRLSFTILGVLILASASFGIYQLDRVRELMQNASASDNERAALQKKNWELLRQNGELKRRRMSVAEGNIMNEGNGASPREEGRAQGPGGNQGTFRDRPDSGRFGAMLANPEVQKLMAVQQKAALDGHYSSLFKQLQLSSADLDKFKNLLVEKQSAVMDVMAAARAEGLTGRENRDQIHELVQNAQSEVDNTIRSTLGDAAYSQYQNYEATLPQRNVVSQLEQRLSYSATPLTDTQSQQLVQILADTAPANSNRNSGDAGMMRMALGGAGGPAGFQSGGGTPITADAITRAQGVLSAQQVSALQSLQQEQQANAQLRQQMRANFQSQTQNTSTPATTSTASSHPSGT